ncbi:MAG: hypothetical protein CMJ31_01385 [Phycisphaerae bacterium]|nr:hypothetical protein [Phycisphaerae bacterium]
MIGLELAADPQTAQGRLRLGYVRAEGVINPVYQPPIEDDTNVTPAAVYREKAYSVLAKIQGNYSGQAGKSIVGSEGAIAQWFATGAAADKLAENPYAAAAVTGSDEVAKAISEGPKLGRRFEGTYDLSMVATLKTLYDQLNGLDPTRFPKTRGHIAAMDAFAASILADAPAFNGLRGGGRPPAFTRATVTPNAAGGFTALTGYTADLVDTVDRYETLSTDATATLGGAAPTAADKADFALVRQALAARRDAMAKRIGASEEIADAVAYFGSLLTPGGRDE